MMTSLLEKQLVEYQFQLSQVERTLVINSTSDLRQLHSDIQKLICLTKETLLEEKRKELINQVKDIYGNVDTIKDEDPTANEFAQNDIDLEELIGVKCRAPHRITQNSNHVTFHNAVVFQAETVLTHDGFEHFDVIVHVIFTHPTQSDMIPCFYYLQGKCTFGSKCQYSHGFKVPFSEILEYIEPDFNVIDCGSNVLAKCATVCGSGSIWRHAQVQFVENNRSKVVVQLTEGGAGRDVLNLSMEDILPLTTMDAEKSDLKNEEIEVSAKQCEVTNFDEEFAASHQIQNSSGSNLGQWEKYTKGIGSKLMASMGYVFGTGLGAQSQGRVEPVSIKLYPAGKSLDWCMEAGPVNESTNGKICYQGSCHIRGRKKQFRLKTPKSEGKPQIFDFINSKLSLSPSPANSLPSGKFQQIKSSLRELKIASFNLDENKRRHQCEIQKLTQSLKRGYIKKDSVASAHIKLKLSRKEKSLAQLEKHSGELDAEQNRRKDHEKLRIF